MNKMLDTYSDVHNDRYWQEISPFIESVINGGTVLDMGCGPGLLLNELDERFSPSMLIGVDLSEVMIEKANEILSNQREQGRLKLIQQHLQEDPTLPKNLDLIVTSRVLRSFEDQGEIMMSIHSSLNSGGRIVLLDWAQAPITIYEAWFIRHPNEFKDLSSREIIDYHRNFSRYSIQDWHYIFKSFDFKIIHSFQLDSVICCVIAEKEITA